MYARVIEEPLSFPSSRVFYFVYNRIDEDQYRVYFRTVARISQVAGKSAEFSLQKTAKKSLFSENRQLLFY